MQRGVTDIECDSNSYDNSDNNSVQAVRFMEGDYPGRIFEAPQSSACHLNEGNHLCMTPMYFSLVGKGGHFVIHVPFMYREYLCLCFVFCCCFTITSW